MKIIKYFAQKTAQAVYFNQIFFYSKKFLLAKKLNEQFNKIYEMMQRGTNYEFTRTDMCDSTYYRSFQFIILNIMFFLFLF